MLEKIIIIENGEEVQCETLEEIVKILIDEDYYNMSQEDRTKKMRMKAIANCINNKMEIVANIEDKNIEGKFIVRDEITYILSLLTTNNIILLERIDANIFTKDIPKENLKGNYIVVNKFAKELLKRII